jgi:hypothetical protein
MSGSTSALSTSARPEARSVRHSQSGARERRGNGAASISPQDVASPPVSAADPLPLRQGLPPLARVVAAAALTTFEGQAIFQILRSDDADMPQGEIFRLRRGSRSHEGLGERTSS